MHFHWRLHRCFTPAVFFGASCLGGLHFSAILAPRMHLAFCTKHGRAASICLYKYWFALCPLFLVSFLGPLSFLSFFGEICWDAAFLHFRPGPLFRPFPLPATLITLIFLFSVLARVLRLGFPSVFLGLGRKLEPLKHLFLWTIFS